MKAATHACSDCGADVFGWAGSSTGFRHRPVSDQYPEWPQPCPRTPLPPFGSLK
jgi:hypothetical protein